MTVLRMDNVGIVVNDMDAAIDFFVELGLRLEGRDTRRRDRQLRGRVPALLRPELRGVPRRARPGARRLEMTSYLVLLRGINVGGRNKVPMAELRSVLEDLGFENVSTYIASGNAFLDSDLSGAKVAAKIEEALPKRFKLHSELVRIGVLSRAELEAVVKRRPKGFGDEPGTFHSDAVFLMGIDTDEAMTIASRSTRG